MRRQLPAFSPLTATGLLRAARSAMDSPSGALEALRSHLAVRFETERVCLTGSGTQALQLALELATMRRLAGDGTVALPAYTCYDVVTAALGAESRVRFYDVDPHTLAPDLDSLRSALRSGAAAAVVANLFGFPVDWDAVRAEASSTGALVIEDAAQGLGSTWHQSPAGSFGDLTVLSFGRGKGWTGGGGGALLVREAVDAPLDEKLALADGGWAVLPAVLSWVQMLLGRPVLYGLATAVPGTGLGETRFKEPVEPVRMSPLCASTALEHAEASSATVVSRRAWAATWRSSIESLGPGSPLRCCAPLAENACGYLRFAARCAEGTEAREVAEQLGGYGFARAYPRALPELEAVARIVVGDASVPPGARDLAKGLVTLPTHPLVARRDVIGAVARMKMFPGRASTD